MPAPLERLIHALGEAECVLILPHNDPDPDAIASAAGLSFLLGQNPALDIRSAYQGIIGRAENKALVRYLGHPLRRLTATDLQQARAVALVDTQPGAGNNALPPGHPVSVVLDHHPLRNGTSAAVYADVRVEAGATSTIVTEYLQSAGLEPPPPLATALFYGIKTDTMGLARGASADDIAAYFYLQPRIDVEALVEIERAQVPAEYFQSFATTLKAARVYTDTVISYLGPMAYPDQAAEMADLLLRLEGTQWVICMGTNKGKLILAVRTRGRKGGAGKLIQSIVGDQGSAGGHGTLAGGEIPLVGREPGELAEQLGLKALALLQLPPQTSGRPLIS